MAVDCLLHPESPLPDESLIRRAEALASSLISDVFGRLAGAAGIMPIAAFTPGQVVAGPALTVRTRPGDNLAVHHALDIARPGEIVVVDAGGNTDRAILGGLMGRYATTRGIKALVIHGAVRDKSDLDRLAPPTFATGLNHLGPYKDGPGELRGTITLGSVPVHDGDIIVGDEDGIAVIPRARAEEIIELAERKLAAESAEFAAIEAGSWDRSWITRQLNIIPVDH